MDSRALWHWVCLEGELFEGGGAAVRAAIAPGGWALWWEGSLVHLESKQTHLEEHQDVDVSFLSSTLGEATKLCSDRIISIERPSKTPQSTLEIFIIFRPPRTWVMSKVQHPACPTSSPHLDVHVSVSSRVTTGLRSPRDAVSATVESERNQISSHPAPSAVEGGTGVGARVQSYLLGAFGPDTPSGTSGPSFWPVQ